MQSIKVGITMVAEIMYAQVKNIGSIRTLQFCENYILHTYYNIHKLNQIFDRVTFYGDLHLMLNY